MVEAATKELLAISMLLERQNAEMAAKTAALQQREDKLRRDQVGKAIPSNSPMDFYLFIFCGHSPSPTSLAGSNVAGGGAGGGAADRGAGARV